MSIYSKEIVNFVACKKCVQEDAGVEHLAVGINIDNEIVVSCTYHQEHIVTWKLADDVVSDLIKNGCDCCE